MLTLICIRNFTLVEQLDLELHQGLTAITGETGAGKSLLLDALGMALGDKADADKVRIGCARAEVSATFDLSHLPQARQWLATHEFESDSECILRRTLTAEGRSRAFINGQSATLAQLRALGELLLNIHSQHAHQKLLKTEHQRSLLDHYGGHTSLCQAVRDQWQHWQKLNSQLQYQRDNEAELSARSQLLRYQVEELDQLNLQAGELEQLESEHRQLACAEQMLGTSQQLAALCSDEEPSLLNLLHKGLQLLRDLPEKSSHLQDAEQLLIDAKIHVEEAASAIDHHLDSFELDPERLQWLETRLDAIYRIARKHRIAASELPALHQQLNEELAPLASAEGGLDQLAEQVANAELGYRKLANQLSQQRRQLAVQLTRGINRQLHQLGMEAAKVDIDVSDGSASAHGVDAIEFLVSTNPGQPARPLSKVASGGELARISLAIEVCVANKAATPTLVFDEVDVGIGGATADIVGRLLRQLGREGQVICVTHLAQVASKAHQHLQVQKRQRKGKTQSTLVHLVGEEKIEEIARMMGGVELTEQTRAHAREMLALGT